MRIRRMNLFAGFTVFVLCISVCTTTSDATVIWQDNFDDLDDWTIFGYENTSSQVRIEGNFSAADGTLKVLDDDVNIARHESSVTVGTWSFDMYVPNDGDGEISVEIMSNGTQSWVETTTNNSLVVVGAYPEDDRFRVWWRKLTSSGVLATISDIPLPGWHHIEVSRTSDHHFYVSFNGTLKAEFVSDSVTKSTYLQFFCYNAAGAAIDNLVVRDDVPTTTPTTPTSPTLPWELIAIVGGVAIGVIVLAIVVLRRR
jgi:hypothetical protein